MQADDPLPPAPKPDPPSASQPDNPGQASQDRPWRRLPQFEVTGIERDLNPYHGPRFAADSPTALIVLTGIIGPTAVLTLRTLAIVARTGPATWHIADLAAIHGVTNSTMRHTLDRLHRFGWLDIDTPDRVDVYLDGSLSQRRIDRLHPAVADHYLARRRSPTPPTTVPTRHEHHATAGPSIERAQPPPKNEPPTADGRGTAHHIVHQWGTPPELEPPRPLPDRAVLPRPEFGF
jgi:hypothetical protein